MFCQDFIVKKQAGDPSDRTLRALCFLVVDCGHIDLGFILSSSVTTLIHKMAF